MTSVQFSRICLNFGDRDILKDVTLNLQSGTKAALTGANGSGKSTLIKVMAGELGADSGERAVQAGCRIAYLPQSALVHKGCTLLEEADKAFEWGYELQRRADEIGEALKHNPSNAGYLVREHERLLDALESGAWYRRGAQAETTLLGLGFTKDDFRKRCEEFSLGWQMRLALAKVLMSGADILLLDEPTNYLDIEARSWLLKFLLDFKGGFLIVSHDRYFLDHAVNEVYELFGGALRRYPGNFSHYEQVRQTELASLIAAYNQQQREIEHLESFIRRFGYKATKAAQAQERQKMLDKVLAHRIEIPENLKKIHFNFPPAPRSGNVVLTLKNVSKTYDGARYVISALDMTLLRGERLIVVGRNGAGKSTLLRIIAGADRAFEGSVALGTGVSSGYFSQDNAERISGSATILEHLEGIAPLSLIPSLRDMLGGFLFRGDDVFKPLDVLSGGEKSRVALLELLLRSRNLLVLDEPTNHLDMHSKDVLLDALRDFGGTVIFVSHDRGFMEALSTKVLELKDGGHREFVGGYAYYAERVQAEEQGREEPQKAPRPTDARLSWQEQKEREAARRRLQKQADALEQEIELAEQAVREIEERLSKREVYSDGVASKKAQEDLRRAKARLEELNDAWLSAAEKL